MICCSPCSRVWHEDLSRKKSSVLSERSERAKQTLLFLLVLYIILFFIFFVFQNFLFPCSLEPFPAFENADTMNEEYNKKLMIFLEERIKQKERLRENLFSRSK